MTREQVLSILENELSKLVKMQAGELAEGRILAQVINSVGFLQLLVSLEKRLGVPIGDEAIYEAAPVTIGDLVDFLYSLVAQPSPE